MLDVETKSRINTARDILVGKVPDPKSQVEQITIALIYKFMDDMDVESEELGGKRTFFVGEYAKYAWRKIFDPRQSGYELLNLYSEAIGKMDTNPGVPKLFRDIFKNAYLPYRDPETLKSFLKIINEFDYSHSEKLGDAFEYLLSVLGSQGDAGQFRTPRHIIDFMVEIVDPKKDETILDPACGTAGFLISSYKHIIMQNSSNYNPDDHNGNSSNGDQSVADRIISTNGYAGDKLTADDRKILARNIHGYDISPDMVRLSLVNMYLHGIKDPKIFEYDTLTSEDNWHHFSDVILANPPFMSPKGGIKPHKRFSVPSNRSEVLFVDYITEHLTANGRAAVIVPEGIIFQSGKAYKQLRKKLVDECLVGVISLPAGVFHPYSGVKTSILWLDKVLAKKSDKILFIKIENDGFDLGAQRRAVKGSDFPATLEAIINYKRSFTDVIDIDNLIIRVGMTVPKQQVSKNGEYVLNGERFRPDHVHRSSKFPLIEIGEICELINGRAFKPEDWETAEKGGLPIIRIQNLNDLSSGFNYYSGEDNGRYLVEPGELLFSWSGSRGTSFGAHIWYGGRAILNQHIFKVRYDSTKATKKYFYYALNKAVGEVEQNLHGGVGLVHITKGNLERIKIPLPPLPVQEEIVAEIESFQKIIDGARQVVENYKPRIDIDPEWEMVKLGELSEVRGGKRLPKGETFSESPTPYPYIRVTDLREMTIDLSGIKYIPKEIQSQISRYTISVDDVYISIAGTIGLFGTVPEQLDGGNLTENAAKLIIDKTRLNKFYLTYVGNSPFVQEQIKRLTHAVGVPKLALERIRTIEIPLPPLNEQQQIAVSIEQELSIIGANKKLIEVFEQKIRDRISKVWGE